MGADDRPVFLTVVVPLILPYLVSGYAFAFVLSLNEYIVAYMTVGFILETLPIKIFNALRYGYTPTMASVSIFLVAVAAAVFVLIARYADLPRLPGARSAQEREGGGTRGWGEGEGGPRGCRCDRKRGGEGRGRSD